MKSHVIGLVLVMGLMGPVGAQVPVVTAPSPTSTKGGNSSTTIGTGGGTFQLVFAGAAARRGCTIVNKSGSDDMWVTEGIGVGGSSETLGALVLPGYAWYCANPGGTVLTGEVDITGTAGDGFYAAQY